MAKTTTTVTIDKKPIILKEYGRNVQNIAAYIQTVSDREKRTLYAKALIDLMRQINPALNESQDTMQKLWDDLYIMSEFKLDVDGPYPKPDENILYKKPRKLPYNTNRLYYKHYGRNVEILIGKIIDMEKEEDKEAGIIYIGRLMKSLYISWNKESIDDAVIAEHIEKISKGELKVNIQKIKEGNLFSLLYNDSKAIKKKKTYEHNQNHHNYKKKKY